jgi:hypothetical protein
VTGPRSAAVIVTNRSSSSLIVPNIILATKVFFFFFLLHILLLLCLISDYDSRLKARDKRSVRTVFIYLLLQHSLPGPLAFADGAASGAAGPQPSGPSLACGVGRPYLEGRRRRRLVSAMLRTSLHVQQRHVGRPEGNGYTAYGGGMHLHVGRSTMGPAYITQGCPLRANARCGDRSWGRMPGVVDS